MNKQLQLFFDNTKQLHILLSITLFMIIVIIVAPINLGYIRKIGQLVIIALLSYILYMNFTETRLLSLVKQSNGNDKESVLDIDMKNNIIASYILCLFILLLLLYVMYSFFY